MNGSITFNHATAWLIAIYNMLVLDPAMEALRTAKFHRFAAVWTITRLDGTIYRFTDHDMPITVGGNEHTPVNGVKSSAIQKTRDFKTENVQMLGVLDDSSITDQDLLTGLFRDATVEWQLVDWLFPWQGYFRAQDYVVGDVSHDGINWVARLESLERDFTRKIGRRFTRSCPYILGSTECGATRVNFSPAITAVDTQDNSRRKFTVTWPSSPSVLSCHGGEVVWTSGDNNGLSGVMREGSGSIPGSVIIILHTPMPHEIDTSDDITIYQGCDKTLVTCDDRFSNSDNYGGFPAIPGTDNAVKNQR